MKQRVFPSILAKNQAELSQELQQFKGLVRWLHLDIVDGKFAPNHSLHFPLKLSREFSYQAHLMVQNPEPWIKRYWRRLALFIPHVEAVKNPLHYIHWMKQKKRKVAFAILPETNVQSLRNYLLDVDYLLILTVHPGFYGRPYLKSELRKIPQIKKINPKVKVIVDGGMNPTTIVEAIQAGADYFISGSYLHNSGHSQRALQELTKHLRSQQQGRKH